jgi:predicted short-subunit dehydrogenase-like oxidoreductase (DUF2520 family)
MASRFFISIIGSGNLAWHLAPALENAGMVIKEVYSRNPNHAAALTERCYQAEVKATLDFSTSDSRLFVITVSDDAIQDIAREIILPDDAILVHTSGSKPLGDLQFSAAQNLGVLYPLQTFSRGVPVDFKEIPIFLESLDEDTAGVLMQVAKSISNQVHRIGSEERKALHIAAVFASNFPNHMLTISKDILQANSLEFQWVIPLVKETIRKALLVGPESSQTGPARRGDLEVMDSHMESLENEHIREIYKQVSQSILDKYHTD